MKHYFKKNKENLNANKINWVCMFGLVHIIVVKKPCENLKRDGGKKEAATFTILHSSKVTFK